MGGNLVREEPRTIKGPCFDCEEVCACAQYVWMCTCHFSDDEQTEPTPKLSDVFSRSVMEVSE